MMSVASHSAVASMLISVEVKGENQLEPSQENMGMLQCRHNFLCLIENLTKNERFEGDTNCRFSIFRDVSF